jgi:hypothetical protein
MMAIRMNAAKINPPHMARITRGDVVARSIFRREYGKYAAKHEQKLY